MMERIRVLYVDDEPALLELGKLFLERDGELLVTTCESAPEAIRLLSTDTFDAIISDFQMPQMDGIEFLRHIREQGNKTPFIIFTGKGREDVVIDAINSGADFYIQKGGDPKPQFAELSNKVRYAVARRRSENALRESEERYRGVVEDQTEFICRFLPDGTILFVNDAYCRYFGLDRATIIGKRFVPVIHPDDKQKVTRFFATRTPKDPSGTIDQRIIMPDGQVLWQTWSTRAIYNEGGGIREFQSVGRDITEQKLAIIALVKSEERYRMFAENITETITVLDLNLQITYVSPSIRTLRGYIEEEAIQQSLEDILTPSSLKLALVQFQEEMQRESEGQGDPQKTISIDLEEYKKDGTTIWVNNTIRFIRDKDGRPTSLLIVSRDITEQKKAEIALIEKSDELLAANEELTATEAEIRHQFNELFKAKQEIESVKERLLLAMDAAEHGFWDWDLITNKAYFSPGYYTMLGYEPDEFPGNYQTWIELLYPDDAKTVVPRIEEHIRKMEPYEEDFRLRCKDGRYRWISGRGKVFISESTGKPSRALGVHVDIDDRKRMELELLHKNQELTTIGEELKKQCELRAAGETEIREQFDALSATKEKLQRSEERYRLVVEHAREAIIILKDGMLVYANPKSIEMLHTGNDDILNQSFTDFVHPGDRARFLAQYEKQIVCTDTGDTTKSFDIRLVCKTGDDYWGSLTLIRIEWDERPAALLFLNDITEQKKVLDALKESEELYRTLINNTNDIIWQTTTNLEFTFINDAQSITTGYEKEEIIGHYLFEFLTEESTELVKNRLFQRLSENSQKTEVKRSIFEIQMKRKNGSVIWIEVSVTPIIWADGSLAGFQGISRDITSRKATEDALIAEREQLISIFDSIDEPVYITDPATNEVLYVNKKLKQILGKDPTGGKCYQELHHKESPCEFCTNNRIFAQKYEPYRWEHYNEILGKHYAITDRIIHWPDGREVRLELAIDITRLKQIEEELRKSRNLLLATQRLAVIGGWEWSPDETLTWTEEMYRIHELNPDDIPPGSPDLIETSLSCFAPADRSTLKDAFWRCVREGKPYDMELPFTTIKGKRLWIRTVGKAVIKDKHTVCVIGFFSDITERKQALLALQEERDLFSGGPVCTIIWGVSENWPVLSVSRNVHEILGYTPEELTDENFRYTMLVHPGDLERIEQEANNNIANHIETYEQSYRLRRKDGEYRWFYDYTKLVRDEFDQVEMVRGYLIDQTRQKEYENLLVHERQHLADIIEATHLGTWEWNIKSGEITMNERGASIIGYSLHELEPITIETWKRLIHPQDKQKNGELLMRHFHGELDYYVSEYRIQHKGGHWIWIHNRGKVSSWINEKEPLLMQGTLLDITERKQAEMELRAVNKKLTLLSGITRHDILNKLMIQKNYLDLLEEEAGRSQYLAGIREAAETIERQIAFTRQYEELGTRDPEWLSLEKMLSAIEDTRIPIQCTCHNISIYADPMLERVFFNLYDNTLRHAEETDTIRVSCRKTQSSLIILWEDKGPGIPHNQKEQIFERGFGKNTGLGLFLTREILSLTDITISENGTYTKGAEFVIRIPDGNWKETES